MGKNFDAGALLKIHNVAPVGTVWRWLSCSDCGEIKAASEFYKHPSVGDGHLLNCRECRNRSNRERYARRPETREAVKRSQAKISCEKRAEWSRTWKRRNMDTVRADTNARRRRMRRQCPSWADRKAIRAFYRNCPPGYEVDHVIPLRGRNVSGLHLVENLQYLPALDNRRKGNEYGSEH